MNSCSCIHKIIDSLFFHILLFLNHCFDQLVNKKKRNKYSSNRRLESARIFILNWETFPNKHYKMADVEGEPDRTEQIEAKPLIKDPTVSIYTSDFCDFNLKPEILRAIDDCGFEFPFKGKIKFVVESE